MVLVSGPVFSFYRDIMGFWKFFPFLALSSVWILCLASSSQAAPFRSALESSLDPATLSEQEKRLLLVALMQNYYEQARKLEQEEQEAEGSSITGQKRSCNTATCVTHRLAGFLSRSGGVAKDNFVPTNVGSNTYGRRRRDLHA
ncbi:Calcitonin gene-related peptide 2 [Cricetulus griseus]|uniref:Calcitonin gene-related peptide 2 n=2 Tax=Cricetulus griseus TaxID=10029 RepID=G3HSD9_CRIGR|nr:Calcitonin gene-related peptide 2 [Cricetulus griseus]